MWVSYNVIHSLIKGRQMLVIDLSWLACQQIRCNLNGYHMQKLTKIQLQL